MNIPPHPRPEDAPDEAAFFEPLARKAQTLFGVAHTPEARARLFQAMKARLARLELDSFSAYDALLRREPAEWDKLWPLALPSAGAFLRPAAQFEVAAEVLSEWAVMAPERTLRVLSLGCGPGFETASLAMMLEETGLRAKNWQVEIHGLDLNPEAVALAENAVFTAADLEWLPESQARKWFTPRAGGFHFKTTLAPPIHLARGNAYQPEDWPFPSQDYFDLIFCRELTFEAPPQAPRQLARLLRQALTPSGFIFTAPGEFLPDNSGDLHLEERAGVTYYRRGTPKVKVNRHHQTRKEKAGRAAVSSTPESLSPLTPRELQLLADAEQELQQNRPEAARALVNEVLLSALDRYRPAPEAWPLIARIETALGRHQGGALDPTPSEGESDGDLVGRAGDDRGISAGLNGPAE